MTREEMETALAGPLDENRVKDRQAGGGRTVSYLPVYDIIDAANRIFGPFGWSYTISDGPRLITPTEYIAVVKVAVKDGEGGAVIREDVGKCGINASANGVVSDEQHEMGSSGAVSDAMRRALRTFGPQFGNSLYDPSRRRVATAPSPSSHTYSQPAQNNGAPTRGYPAPPPATGFVPTYRMGKFKGQPFTAQSVAEARSYTQFVREHIYDPGKEQYVERNLADVAQMDAWIASQEAQGDVPGDRATTLPHGHENTHSGLDAAFNRAVSAEPDFTPPPSVASPGFLASAPTPCDESQRKAMMSLAMKKWPAGMMEGLYAFIGLKPGQDLTVLTYQQAAAVLTALQQA